ncbi:MAG: hypothetical protein Q7T56_16450, partial [Nocardioidaceae bacterium]|nr:hypothetical protein [Nocardioidaceae bacterium]
MLTDLRGAHPVPGGGGRRADAVDQLLQVQVHRHRHAGSAGVGQPVGGEVVDQCHERTSLALGVGQAGIALPVVEVTAARGREPVQDVRQRGRLRRGDPETAEERAV